MGNCHLISLVFLFPARFHRLRGISKQEIGRNDAFSLAMIFGSTIHGNFLEMMGTFRLEIWRFMGRFRTAHGCLRFDGSEVPGITMVLMDLWLNNPFPTVDGSEIRRSPPGMYKTL